MAPKPGNRCFLFVGETFDEPRWREALVIQVEDEWAKTLIKGSSEEIDRTGLTKLEHKGGTFCLVEAETYQLRAGMKGDCMMLGGEHQALLDLGKKLVESDEEVNFATASEPAAAAAPRAKSKAPPRKKSIASESESEESEEGEDALAQLRKSWLGDGTKSGRHGSKSEKKDKKRSHRFSLISRRRSEDDGKDEEDLTSALMEAVKQSDDPLRSLLALQIAQATQKKSRGKKKRRSRSTSSSRSSQESSESSGSSGSGRRKGYEKAIHCYQSSGKKMHRRPLHYVRRFVRSVEKELGAEDRPWKLVDDNRKIHFGKQQNLKRCHYLMATVLDLLLREEYHRAALMATLCLQAQHQAALDGGWDIAWLLTHLEDPWKAKVFGGDPSSLQHVTAYMKSLSELSKSADSLRKKGVGRGDEENSSAKENGKGKGKQGNSQKQKDKDKDKDKGQTDA